MNEADPEIIELRAAEAEERRLHALLDQAIADLNAAVAELTPPDADLGQALLSRALEGEPFEVLAMPTRSACVPHLLELISVLFSAIETQSFKCHELLRRAVNADQPRQVEQLAALGRTDADVVKPVRHNGGGPR